MTTIREVLDAVDTAMTTIKTIAEAPGVSALPYVSALAGVIGAAHAAYVAEKNIQPYIDAIKGTFTPGSVPTQLQIDDLNALIAALEADADKPLPPLEADEPE